MVVDTPGDDFYGKLGRTGFHELLRGVAGPTPTLALTSEMVEATTATLLSGDPETQVRACQLLGSAAEQLCDHHLNGRAPRYLDALTAVLVDPKRDLQVRIASVGALANFGAAYERRGNIRLLWPVSRILDMVERQVEEAPEGSPDLLRELRRAREVFHFLDQKPPVIEADKHD